MKNNYYVPYGINYLKIFTEKDMEKIHQYVHSGILDSACICNFFLIVIYCSLYILTSVLRIEWAGGR